MLVIRQQMSHYMMILTVRGAFVLPSLKRNFVALVLFWYCIVHDHCTQKYEVKRCVLEFYSHEPNETRHPQSNLRVDFYTNYLI